MHRSMERRVGLRLTRPILIAATAALSVLAFAAFPAMAA
jgi:hypothetical protein